MTRPARLQGGPRRYWSTEERERFQNAIRTHGADFGEIAKAVGTRNSTQVRTHVHKVRRTPSPAQPASHALRLQYHLKLVREFKASRSGFRAQAPAGPDEMDADGEEDAQAPKPRPRSRRRR